MKRILVSVLSFVMVILSCVIAPNATGITMWNSMENNKDLVVTDDIGFETTCLYKYNAITGRVSRYIFDFSEYAVSSVAVGEEYVSSAYTPYDHVESRGIIGQDDRDPVTNVSESPYCKVVKMKMTFENEQGQVKNTQGTGFIVGPNLVITAAHVIVYPEYGFWPVSCNVYTEYLNDSTYEEESSVIEYIIHKEMYDHSANRTNYDWAILRTDSDIGNRQGWFGFGFHYTFSNFVDTDIKTVGFPGDLPTTPSAMYECDGKITACPTKYLAYHNADTRGNQSGSPIYDTDQDQIVWAVHNAGGTSYNVSQKITPELFYVIKKEKQESIAEWNA